MISVCMATYNGERFIAKQLETIYNQSLKADEVIICDDGSKDETVSIIEQFINEHHLKNIWKIYRNTVNKGYPGNFYYAMSLCSGDVVFLADQDDVWESDKIKNMMQIMAREQGIGLLASRWGIIDQEGKVLREVSRGKCSGTDALVNISIKDILYCYDWPGMCMCYRKDVGERVLEKVKDSMLAHDVALGVAAAEAGTFYCVNQRNQFHRRHDANVAEEEHRARKLLNKKRKIYEIEKYLHMLQEILDSRVLMYENSNLMIESKKNIMQERLDNLKAGLPLKIIKQYTKHQQDIRWATLICDLVICRQKL